MAGLFEFNPLSDVGNFLSGVGSFAGSMASIFGNRHSTAKQVKAQKELIDYQNKINVFNYQHAHQWEVSDLKDAGLNPILSANSGHGVASAGDGMTGNTVNQEEANKIAKFQAGMQALAVMADSANKLSNARLMEEQAKNQPFLRNEIATNALRNLQQNALMSAQAQQALSAVQLNKMYGAEAMANSVLLRGRGAMLQKFGVENTGSLFSVLSRLVREGGDSLGNMMSIFGGNSGQHPYTVNINGVGSHDY